MKSPEGASESFSQQTEEKEHRGIGFLDRIRNYFRRSAFLVIATALHSPFVIGGFMEAQARHYQPLDYELGPSLPKEPSPEQKKEDPFEKKKKEIYEKIEKTLEIREKEREKNKDPEKIEEFKARIRSQLEKGEHISFSEFIFEAEEVMAGIDKNSVDNARKVFSSEMEELKKKRPVFPTPEFLQEVLSYTERDESDVYELTQTHVSVYLDRKGKGLRGNCQARAKYRLMALDYLYPFFSDKLKLQRLLTNPASGHVTALMDIGETTYVIDGAVKKLTPEMKGGTAIFSLRDYMRNIVGIPVEPVEVAKPVKIPPGKKAPEVELPDDEAKFFPTPPITDNKDFPFVPYDGKLQAKSVKKDNRYVGDFVSPEILKLEEEKRKRKASLPSRPPGTASVQIPFFDVSDLQVVYGKDGEILEVLPWKSADYGHDQLYPLLHYQATFLPSTFPNPTKASIERIHQMRPWLVTYQDVSTFSLEAVKASLRHKGHAVAYMLSGSYIPPALRNALSNKNESQYPTNLALYAPNSAGESFDKNDLLSVIRGKGPISIFYGGEIDIDRSVIDAIAKSSRTYVYIFGAPLKIDVEAVKSIKEPHGARLLIDSQNYLLLVASHPELLENRFLKVADESSLLNFYNYNLPTDPDDPVSKVLDNTKQNAYMIVYNAYILSYRFSAKGYPRSYVSRLLDIADRAEDYMGIRYNNKSIFRQAKNDARKAFQTFGLQASLKMNP